LRPQVTLDVGVNCGECLFSANYSDQTRSFGVEANPQLIPYIEQSRADHPSRNRMEIIADLVLVTKGTPRATWLAPGWQVA
jgi:hypothetical protein